GGLVSSGVADRLTQLAELGRGCHVQRNAHLRAHSPGRPVRPACRAASGSGLLGTLPSPVVARTAGYLAMGDPLEGTLHRMLREGSRERDAHAHGVHWLGSLPMDDLGPGELPSASLASTRTPFQVFAVLVEPPLLCIGLLGIVVRAATCISGER